MEDQPARDPAPPGRARRRHRPGLREELLEAALEEFAAHGFDGASTASIARRAGAHQPQINYHFASKEALWRASVDHLFGGLVEALGDLPPHGSEGADALDVDVLAETLAGTIGRFVRFAAAHPELNRIVVHEATARTTRLDWLVDTHVRPLAERSRAAWRRLRDAGVAAPLDDRFVHHVIVGAASLVYVNAPEFERLHGEDPARPDLVDRHADGVVAMLLPGRRPAAP
ncbi:MAG: TetR/AcrR family transcriptional regulator [Acidimicrobiales bacterium]|nr:TetR/AcrR family transcriptional regulator [Acidimicrobiales bacterium]